MSSPPYVAPFFSRKAFSCLRRLLTADIFALLVVAVCLLIIAVNCDNPTKKKGGCEQDITDITRIA